MNIAIKPLAEINYEAIKALSDKLGIADSIRFINQFYSGHGNYTEERKDLFKNMNLEDIIEDIERTIKTTVL